MCEKKANIFYEFFIIAIFMLSFSTSIISISLLKERFEKLEDVRKEYEKLETKFSDILKNNRDFCETVEGRKDNSKCAIYHDADNRLHNTWLQILRIKQIENRGAPNSICGGIASITSGSEGFENSCYAYSTDFDKSKLTKPEHLTIYNSISNGFKYCGFDKLPSEALYLILVLSCSLLGAIYNFKKNIDDLLKISFAEILRYYSLGFIAYVIATGAKFVVLLGNQQLVTNVNPYSIALVGILSGMFFDRFFSLKNSSQGVGQPTDLNKAG